MMASWFELHTIEAIEVDDAYERMDSFEFDLFLVAEGPFTWVSAAAVRPGCATLVDVLYSIMDFA